MSKKTKLVTLICASMIGIIIMLAVVSVLFITGVISLDKSGMIISTGSAEAKYDGTPLTNHTWDVDKTLLKKGHEISFSFKGSQTNVGESDNLIEIKITDELGADVTSDYSIEYRFGKLKINPRRVLVTYTENLEKGVLEYEVSDKYDKLVVGHTLVMNPADDNGSWDSSDNEDAADDPAAELPKYDVVIYDEFGKDITYNYQVFMSEIKHDETESESGIETESENESESESEEGSSGESNNPTQELFEITATSVGKIYLKLQSYGSFTGNDWTEAPEFAGDQTFSPYYLTSAALLASGEATQSVNIKSLCGLYVLPYYALADDPSHFQTSDVFINGELSIKDGGFEPYRINYVNLSSTSKLNDPYYMAYEEMYRTFVYNNYLDVDYETLEYMYSVIDAQGFDPSDRNIINKVAEYISNAATYNLMYDQSLDHAQNMVIDFLDMYKEGVCRHYAAAATMLYRSLGIPARYTVGFAAPTAENTTVIVRAKNAHAWVEVYIDGMGWVCVEVTGAVGENEVEPGIMNGSTTDGLGAGYGSGGNQNLADDVPKDLSLYYITPSEDVSAVYLREGSCGDFDGRTWYVAPEFEGLIRDGHSASFLSSVALESSAAFTQSIAIEPCTRAYALPSYVYLSSAVNTFIPQASDTVFTGDMTPYYTSYIPASYMDFRALGTSYEVEDFESYYAYRDYVYSTYTSVEDGELKDYLNGIIDQYALRGNDVYSTILQVSLYIRSCASYNLEYDKAIDDADDIVLAFLQAEEGICRHFASAATITFRLLGLPARYTYGAVGNAYAYERTEVTGEQAHAWVEVYIDGIGWVQVEVTPSFGNILGGMTDNSEAEGEDSENVLTVTASPFKADYTGNEISFPAGTIVLDGFEVLAAEGYSFEPVFDTPAYIEPGTHHITVSDLRFYSPQGSDVTDIIKALYKINGIGGYTKLIITRPVRVLGGDFVNEKLYDGKPFDFEAISDTLSPIIDYIYPENENLGHSISVKYTCNATEANSPDQKHRITFEIYATDENGNDVSHEYSIREHIGEINIMPWSIYIKSKDLAIEFDEYEQSYINASGAYDPFTCHEYVFLDGYMGNVLTAENGEPLTEYPLPEGFKLELEFTAEISREDFDAGNTYKDNTFTANVYFVDELGNILTDEEGNPKIAKSITVSCEFGEIEIIE